jgi:hypothetical protein
MPRASSPTYDAYIKKYGMTDAYELEAMQPNDLAQLLRAAIEQVFDTEMFHQGVAAGRADFAQIVAVRRPAFAFFKSLSFDGVDFEEKDQPKVQFLFLESTVIKR